VSQRHAGNMAVMKFTDLPLKDLNGFSVPHAPFKELSHPIGALRADNLISDIPDEVKILVADILMLWGSTGTKLLWITNLIFYRDKKTPLQQVDTWDRYRIMRDIIKDARKTEGAEHFAKLWMLFTTNKHQILSVRNALAHADIKGMLKKPEDCLAMIHFQRDGNWVHKSIPIRTLHLTKGALILLNWGIQFNIDQYQAALVKAWEADQPQQA